MDTNKFELFFQTTFRDVEGFICISTKSGEDWVDAFYAWPKQSKEMVRYIERYSLTHDVYFCAQILTARRRDKDSVLACPLLWADLDTCHPDKMLVRPSIIIESSPGRYQAFWIIDEAMPPFDAERLCKRIAYAHKHQGCDMGWGLSKVMRVPYTRNFKYMEKPSVEIIDATGYRYASDAFDKYPEVDDEDLADLPFPAEIPDADTVFMKHRKEIHPLVYTLFIKPPKEDWSKTLWQLENLLFESGLEPAEVYAVVLEAACNKYERDNRSTAFLWREICRAYQNQIQEAPNNKLIAGADKFKLLTDMERDEALKEVSFIEEYIEWAMTVVDATPQYHEAGAFVALSGAIAGNIRIPTSFGTVTPNLWFMILADTTLTRKTTSMDMAMDLLHEVNSTAVLATDGSLEGILTGLAVRPGTPSIFLKDEFSGLLEAMSKKEYMAGMGEMLTKLYDGKMQKRVLKKETVEIHDPVLILYTGGIRNRIYELLTPDHVTSGFLPRFIFILGEADLTKIKPVGPPTTKTTAKRKELIMKLQELYDHYNFKEKGKITRTRFKVELTEDAWQRYNQLEAQMLDFAMDSNLRDFVMPSMDRLAKSGLKAAALIKASKYLAPPPVITVELNDILHAFSYVERWVQNTLEVIGNVGKTKGEKILERIVNSILFEPGISQAKLMNTYKLTSREMNEIRETLQARGLIRTMRSGKGYKFEVGGRD